MTHDAHDKPRAAFGELQQRIMRLAWSREEFTIREAHGVLSGDGQIAYTTVQTVMGRLVDRGMLRRELRGRAGVYRAATSDDAAEAAALVEQLVGRFGETAVAQFVDRTRSDPEMFQQLKSLVDARGDRRA